MNLLMGKNLRKQKKERKLKNKRNKKNLLTSRPKPLMSTKSKKKLDKSADLNKALPKILLMGLTILRPMSISSFLK